MPKCTRCAREFTIPAGLELSLNIRASYCDSCARATNARFSAIYAGTDCHDCGKSFDVFNEGYSSQYVTVCGECWRVELSRREAGGVFTR